MLENKDVEQARASRESENGFSIMNSFFVLPSPKASNDT
ncbi:hypothetical protein VP96_02165 [Vibrio cholerae]|nr:hypothetical protein A5C_A0181 [Vibrio cholerae NCTC 8457]KKP13927.1 hypothetical protein VP96_02165 [Vibrio cholerae]CSI22565.1 Uncharacterised protein [Vibrio cholerae]